MKLSVFISSILCSIIEIYIIKKIINQKFLTKIKTILLSISILITYHFFSYLLTNSYVRIILLNVLLMMITKFIYKEKLSKSIFAAFFTWLILLISEVICMIVTYNILKIDIETIQTTPFFHIIFNIIIYFLCYIIINIKPLQETLKKIINKFQVINNKNIILVTLIICILFSLCSYYIYVEEKSEYFLILNLIILIIYAIIIISISNEKEKNYEMKKNIENISENLIEYEKMLDYQRVANHENKNQLLVIKGMLKKNDKEAIDYINSIIKEKREDNEDFYMKTKRIPSGGLQGLIYYKLLTAKEKNINIALNIDSKVRKINFKKYGVDFNKKLCKIIGILMDNAIQAVENLKDKNIEINMKNNENIEIEISNNFSGQIDLSKIGETGYTTKDKGHGYGLTLLNKIIEKEEKIENKKSISGNAFTQQIIIKK